MTKMYVQDKIDDALWEAKLAVLRESTELETHVYVMAALTDLLACEVADWTIKEHEMFLVSNGIDTMDEQDDLKESLKLTLFKTLKSVVDDWKRCAGC